MRRILTALLIALLLVPDLLARTNHDWKNVKKVKPGTPIQILLWTGDNVSGELDEVSDAGLLLYTAARTTSQTTQLHIDRQNIRRIAVIRHVNLPDSGHWMRVGALTGAAVGVAVGGFEDAKQGDNGRWIVGGLVGALVGFFAAWTVVVAVDTAKLAQGPRHTKVIYEAKKSPPPPST